MASNKRYFIAKVKDQNGLQKALETSVWACTDRKNPPHPKDFLKEAKETSEVVLLFSVNGQHGWNGYAKMETAPGIDVPDDSLPGYFFENTAECVELEPGSESPSQPFERKYYKFRMKWERELPGDQYLPLGKIFGRMPFSTLPNFHEVSADKGEPICKQMDEHYAALNSK